MEHLEGALVARALSGPMVQRTNVRSQLVIRQNRQVRAFGHVLTQQDMVFCVLYCIVFSVESAHLHRGIGNLGEVISPFFQY